MCSLSEKHNVFSIGGVKCFSIGGVECVLYSMDRTCSPHPMPETRDHPDAHRVCGCAHKKPKKKRENTC
jgi:hypothetical protein